MIVAVDGLPELGRSARTLGVRLSDQSPNEDVKALIPDDPVFYGGGGMSVTPNDPRDLIRHRRPREFGGTGNDPVWVIDSAELPVGLDFRQDKPKHGLIEPTRGTILKLGDFEMLLNASRNFWKIVTPDASGESE